jgi:hypothetical protein
MLEAKLILLFFINNRIQFGKYSLESRKTSWQEVDARRKKKKAEEKSRKQGAEGNRKKNTGS